MVKQGVVAACVVLALVLGCLPCAMFGWPIVNGSGQVIEQDFDVSGFDAVEMASFGDLVIELGQEEGLRVEAEENLIPYLEISVVGDRLQIRHQPGVWLHNTRPVRFYLTAKSLDTVLLSGSGDITAPDLQGDQILLQITGSGDIDAGVMNGGDIELRISGSGEMDVEECDAAEVRIDINGSGDLRLAEAGADTLDVSISGSGTCDIRRGEVERQAVRITGSGELTSIGMESEVTEVRITGSGAAEVEVSERLDVHITGSGDVRYAGNPNTVGRAVSGSGDITQISN